MCAKIGACRVPKLGLPSWRLSAVGRSSAKRVRRRSTCPPIWTHGRKRASAHRAAQLRWRYEARRMGKRHPNPRLVKLHRSYAVEQIARLFDVHKNTVRAWVKQGLQPIDGQRPALFHGPVLVASPASPRVRKATLSAGPYLLSAMPSAKSTGRKHGGICAGDGHHRQPSRHLSRLRPAYSPAGEPSENQGDSGES
jgi:hypothetical protein